MNATLRDFTTDDAVRVAAASLSRAAGEPIAIEDISPLGDRWPDVPPLPVFPAFATSRED